MKFLFVKDLHIRPNNIKQPAGRKENYYEQIVDKLTQINDYAKKNKIKYLLCAGDIFDIKARSRYTFDSILYIEKIFKETLKDVKIVTIAGNHDLPNSSIFELPRSVYNYFYRKGDLHDVGNQRLVLFNDEDLGEVSVYGIHFQSDIDILRNLMKDLNSNVKPDKFNICMIHEHMLPEAENIYASYLTYDEVFKRLSNFKVILAGHLHKGFEPVFSKSGQVIINPWSFNRLARSHYVLDDKHIPELVEVTINPKGNFKVNTIPLRVQPFKDTFVQNQLSMEQTYHNTITDFISKIEDFKQVNEQYENSPVEIKSKIQQYLEMAETELKG